MLKVVGKGSYKRLEERATGECLEEVEASVETLTTTI